MDACVANPEELLAREVALAALASASEAAEQACELLTELERHASGVASFRHQLLGRDECCEPCQPGLGASGDVGATVLANLVEARSARGVPDIDGPVL
jgi:hypothetical protein